MVFTKIRNVLTLNKIDISEIEGTKVYYNKIICIIYIILFLLGIFSLIFFFIFDIQPTFVIIPISIILFIRVFPIFSIQDIVSKLIFKNPIFILQNKSIYYHKTQQWYSINEYLFEDEFINKERTINLFQSFCIKELKGNIVVSEQNIFLSNILQMKRLIYNYKVQDRKESYSRNA